MRHLIITGFKSLCIPAGTKTVVVKINSLKPEDRRAITSYFCPTTDLGKLRTAYDQNVFGQHERGEFATPFEAFVAGITQDAVHQIYGANQKAAFAAVKAIEELNQAKFNAAIKILAETGMTLDLSNIGLRRPKNPYFMAMNLMKQINHRLIVRRYGSMVENLQRTKSTFLKAAFTEFSLQMNAAPKLF